MGEAPTVITVESGCSACNSKEPFSRVYSAPYVPQRVLKGRDFHMGETRKIHDKSWKKRVMGEKYDGR